MLITSPFTFHLPSSKFTVFTHLFIYFYFFVSLQIQYYIEKTKHNKKEENSNITEQYLLTYHQVFRVCLKNRFGAHL